MLLIRLQKFSYSESYRAYVHKQPNEVIIFSMKCWRKFLNLFDIGGDIGGPRFGTSKFKVFSDHTVILSLTIRSFLKVITYEVRRDLSEKNHLMIKPLRNG